MNNTNTNNGKNKKNNQPHRVRLIKEAEIMKHGEIYVCKRMRMLNYLMNKGFTPTDTIPDPLNPRFRWWKFTNSSELEAVIEEYFDGLNKGGRIYE